MRRIFCFFPHRNDCNKASTRKNTAAEDRPADSSDGTRSLFQRRDSRSKSTRESFEMTKRRARMPVAMFDRPFVSEIEFIVDTRYSSLKVIGTGSFGVVASANDAYTSQRVAIKKILGAFATAKMARYVLREVRLLRHLCHPNIVHLLDIDVPRQYRAWDEVYIVTPLLRMDLTTALKQGIIKTPAQQKRIAYQILSALNHMHSLGLMHRDVKARNIVLDDDLNAQLCDLGHSRFYSKANRDLDLESDSEIKDADEPNLSGCLTTIVQSPPEMGFGIAYDATVDIWSAGCVIAEMVQPGHEGLFDSTGRAGHLAEILTLTGPHTAEELGILPNYAQIAARKLASKDPSRNSMSDIIGMRLGRNADALVVDLLQSMLQFSPLKRISASQALNHPWFDDVRQAPWGGNETYNFGQSEPPRRATKAQMKQLVWKEVVAFHPEVAAMPLS